MNCFDYRSLLAQYLDGDLSASEARQLERHVARCQECGHELQILRDVGSPLRALRDEFAPPELRLSVLSALQGATTVSMLRRRPRFRWGWAALGAGAAAASMALFLPRGNAGEELLRRTDMAVKQSFSLHMRCRWYLPTDRSKMVTQREVWRDGATGRWDEGSATTALIENGGLRFVRSGGSRLPVEAASLTRAPSLETMLCRIVRTKGPNVSFEREDGVSWQGMSYRALVVRDRGRDGNPLRSIFLLDPATSLPVKGEQQRQVDGRWQTEGTLQFEFNHPIDPAVFKAPAGS